MKLIIALMLTFLASSLWLVGDKVAQSNIEHLIAKGDIDFGPLPLRLAKSYDFSGLPRAFKSDVDLNFLSSLTKFELKNFLLNSTHKLYRDGLNDYLDEILSLSEEYKVDPIWVISVVTVESGFNPNAKSHKNARGLMQVRPNTAKHLRDLLKMQVEHDQSGDDLYSPNENLELGVFYLKRLLQNFRYRYDLATVAYNVGPNSLRNSLKEESIVIEDNNYLRKVNIIYGSYLKPYLKLVKGRTFEYKKSQNIASSSDKPVQFNVAENTKEEIPHIYHSERL